MANTAGWGEDRDIAEQLLSAERRGPLAQVKSLSGGRNSRTYLLAEGSGKAWVVKVYRALPNDVVDRRIAEFRFLEHAREIGLTNVARVVATDSVTNATAFTFLPGVPLGHGSRMSGEDIEQMAAFIRDLNSIDAADSGLDPAAEARFSIMDHLTLIDHRVSQLARPEVLDSTTPAARRFVLEDLRPTWDGVFAAAMDASSATGIGVSTTLDSRHLCVSPSDFGPHNTLRSPNGQLFFVDFEYSGVDDPAKLVCDTVLHPELAISRELREVMKTHLSHATSMDSMGLVRTQILWAPYMVKWACIVLNLLVSSKASNTNQTPLPEKRTSLDHQLGLAATQIHRAQCAVARGVKVDV